jgi:hypothetical protein
MEKHAVLVMGHYVTASLCRKKWVYCMKQVHSGAYTDADMHVVYVVCTLQFDCCYAACRIAACTTDGAMAACGLAKSVAESPRVHADRNLW